MIKRGIVLGSGYNYIRHDGWFCISDYETKLEFLCTNELPF